MATITTRAGKGSPLTNAEIDANFSNLNTAKQEADLSGVTEVASNAGTDTLPINQGGAAKRTTIQKVLDWIRTQAITWTAKQTFSGDIELTGTGRRILANFSDATVANRFAFQTNAVNGITNFHVIPNGTSRQSGYKAESDPAMASGVIGAIDTTDTSVTLSSGVRGGFAYAPLLFNVGGAERVRIDTNGSLGVGTSSPNYTGYSKTVTVEGAVNAAVEICSTRADGDGVNMGGLEWNFRTASANHNRIALINATFSGTTAGQRGGRIAFSTKPNGGTSLIERMAINQDGYVELTLFKLLRQDFTSEGGQIDFCRALDGAVAFNIDVQGSGTTPQLRVIGGSGTSATPLRITSGGEVQLDNYTKLGESSPSIKVKKLTVTTGPSIGSAVSVAHGLTDSKIIAIQALINDNGANKFPPGIREYGGREYAVYSGGGYVSILLHSTNSSELLSKPATILITYEA